MPQKGKKRKRKAKTGFKILIALLIFGAIISTLLYNFGNYILKINEMKQTKSLLTGEIEKLKSEEEILQTDIEKLQDPAYVARYAREKYLYSKDGEIILRLPEEQ